MIVFLLLGLAASAPIHHQLVEMSLLETPKEEVLNQLDELLRELQKDQAMDDSENSKVSLLPTRDPCEIRSRNHDSKFSAGSETQPIKGHQQTSWGPRRRSLHDLKDGFQPAEPTHRLGVERHGLAEFSGE